MAATFPRELMILIERIVRPLPIPLARQKRLRSDFEEHLEAIYAEEFARDGDKPAAILRTQERFGNPEAILSELKESIRWPEKFQARVSRHLVLRPAESPFHYAARLSAQYVLLLLIAVPVLLLAHRYARFGDLRLSILDLRMGLAAILSLTLFLGGFLWFGVQLSEEWGRMPRRRERLLMAVLGLLLLYPIILLTLAVCTGTFWLTLPQLMWNSLLGGVLLTIGGLLFAVGLHREIAYRRTWDELELDVD